MERDSEKQYRAEREYARKHWGVRFFTEKQYSNQTKAILEALKENHEWIDVDRNIMGVKVKDNSWVFLLDNGFNYKRETYDATQIKFEQNGEIYLNTRSEKSPHLKLDAEYVRFDNKNISNHKNTEYLIRWLRNDLKLKIGIELGLDFFVNSRIGKFNIDEANLDIINMFLHCCRKYPDAMEQTSIWIGDENEKTGKLGLDTLKILFAKTPDDLEGCVFELPEGFRINRNLYRLNLEFSKKHKEAKEFWIR